MKRYIVVASVFAGMLFSLAGCVSPELGRSELAGRTIELSIFVDPQARIESHFWVEFDPNDPVRTVISVGSHMAKAHEVMRARERMDRAMRYTDLNGVLEEELTMYFEDMMDMRVVAPRRRAEYVLELDVRSYGLNAANAWSGLEFELEGVARLYDRDQRLWKDRFRVSQSVSPGFFGLPGAAGNVLTAAMLSHVSEAEMAEGIERLSRDAAWTVAQELRHDLYRARRRH